MRRSTLQLLLGCVALHAAAGPWAASVQAGEASRADAVIERLLDITRGSEPRRSVPVTITMVSIEDL